MAPVSLRAATALALAAALVLGPARSSPAAPPSPAATSTGTTTPATAPTATHTVTLITGDVVSVSRTRDGQPTAVITHETGSGGYQTQTVGGDLYVIPDSAEPLLAADLLDRELFNVTELVRDGYTTEAGGALPVIASYRGSALARSAHPTPPGADKRRELASINAAALTVRGSDAATFWSSLTAATTSSPTVAPRARSSATLPGGIAKIWLDGRVRATDDVSNPQVGAPQAWAAGYDGTGATVAVLDTGVDTSHPDLAGQVTDTVSFVPGDDTADQKGHGTHVASTIAGTGAASDGRYTGVAPGAKLLVGKVLDDNGFGQDSWVIAGMEWAAAHARVVSMSLGDDSLTDANNPLAQAVDRLTEQTGALFVVAAGNVGGEGTVGSPGTADDALTVGAVDRDDQRAWFSSMGPRGGDHGMKPDIAAPGVDIVAARSADSPGTGPYVSMSGTSMATPHVAAAAAILAARHPDWTATQLKDDLMSTSTELAGTTPFQIGSGRLWIPGALGDVRATGSRFFGFYSWPHDGDDPASRTVDYANAGDSPVTLHLSASAAGPDAAPVTGLFGLSTDTVTVPAHGTAQVTVTADADDAPGVGQFTGQIDATGPNGALVAHTAVALVKEDERYDLDIRVLDRDGRPTGGSVTLYRYGDMFAGTVQADPVTGRVPTQRLPAGVYTVSSWLPVTGTHGPGSTGIALLGTPHLDLDHNTDLVLDARAATRVSVTTPLTARPDYRRMQWFHDSGIGGFFATFSTTYVPSPAVDDLFAAPTGTVPGGQFDFAVRWRLSKPYLSVSGTAGVGRLDPLYFTGSLRLDGRVDLPVVYAGTGTPDEYAGVPARGAAVAITRSDAVRTADAVAAAQQAGAALLVVVNDRPGRFVDRTFGDLPVVSLTAAEGRRLIAATRRHHRVRLHGRATEFSPYKYDLSRDYPDRIPADLAWHVRSDELARVDERYHGSTDEVAFDGRLDCRDYQFRCLGPSDPQGLGRTRVSYVSTGSGYQWYQYAVAASGWEQRFDQVTYRPGQRASMDWFDPIASPHLGPGYWGPYRNGDFFAVNVPTDGGRDTTGSDQNTTIESRLYQNGTLVRSSPFQAVQWPVPHVDGPARYRFEQDTANSQRRFSTATHSTWTFTSATPSSDGQALLPLLQLGYQVDVDLAGNARAGHWATIGVNTWQQPGAVGAGKSVTSLSLEISYDDGKTWQAVRLGHAGTSWTGTVRYPRHGARFVSLRASATDDAGNSVHQEVIRAYGLS